MSSTPPSPMTEILLVDKRFRNPRREEHYRRKAEHNKHARHHAPVYLDDSTNNPSSEIGTSSSAYISSKFTSTTRTSKDSDASNKRVTRSISKALKRYRELSREETAARLQRGGLSSHSKLLMPPPPLVKRKNDHSLLDDHDEAGKGEYLSPYYNDGNLETKFMKHYNKDDSLDYKPLDEPFNVYRDGANHRDWLDSRIQFLGPYGEPPLSSLPAYHRTDYDTHSAFQPTEKFWLEDKPEMDAKLLTWTRQEWPEWDEYWLRKGDIHRISEVEKTQDVGKRKNENEKEGNSRKRAKYGKQHKKELADCFECDSE